MAKVQDYDGGPLNWEAGLKWEDCSKDLLIRSLKLASNLYNGMPGFFYTAIKKRYGDQVAIEVSEEAYAIGTRIQFQGAQRALKLGNTVADCLKYQQFGVDVANMDVECQLKNENLGIVTIRNCTGVLYWERHEGTAWLMEWACHKLAQEGWPMIAHWINPNIKCTALKLPPRKSKDDICCQWEYRLEHT
jgi:hypothetical protein